MDLLELSWWFDHKPSEWLIITRCDFNHPNSRFMALYLLHWDTRHLHQLEIWPTSLWGWMGSKTKHPQISADAHIPRWFLHVFSKISFWMQSGGYQGPRSHADGGLHSVHIFAVSQAVLKLLVHHQVGALRCYSTWCLLGVSKHTRQEIALIPHVQKHGDTRQTTLVLQLVGCFMEILVFPRIKGMGWIDSPSNMVKIPRKFFFPVGFISLLTTERASFGHIFIRTPQGRRQRHVSRLILDFSRCIGNHSPCLWRPMIKSAVCGLSNWKTGSRWCWSHEFSSIVWSRSSPPCWFPRIECHGILDCQDQPDADTCGFGQKTWPGGPSIAKSAGSWHWISDHIYNWYHGIWSTIMFSIATCDLYSNRNSMIFVEFHLSLVLLVL